MRHSALIFISLFLLFCLTFTFVLVSFPATSFAASITQLKGSKALIQLEGDTAKAGQEFYVLDSNGKRVALIKLSQVKGDKAIGDVTKGNAILGGTLKMKTLATETTDRPKAAPTKKTVNRVEDAADPLASRRKKMSGGVLLGYAMNNMSLTVQSTTIAADKEDAKLKDSSFSVKGFMDYDLSKSFTLRFASGLESFATKGETVKQICDSGASTSCEVSFNYLALEGSAHYNFLTGNTRAWLGLGYSFLLQMSKKVNVPNLSADGSTNQMVLIGAGADIGLSGGSFIPLVVEYGMFPGSSNVVANAIYVRGGYGFNF